MVKSFEPFEPLCSRGCGAVTEPLDYTDAYWCPTCEHVRDGEATWAYNDTVRLVWLRTPTLVHSAEIEKLYLMENGTVRGRPGVTWERWL